MTTYQPATSHTDAIERIPCFKCGTTMRLFGIEPAQPGCELWSFECAKCGKPMTDQRPTTRDSPSSA
jgi:hypothetical protein